MERTTRIKSIWIPLLFLILVVNTASAGVSIVNNISFNLNNGAFITVLPVQNSTNITIYNSTNSPASTLQFYINGTPIQFTSNTNKTVSNISYNNVTDIATYTGNGTNGYLNVSAQMKSPSINYYLIVDGINNQTYQSNATGWVIFNYTGWNPNQHGFQIITIPPKITSWSNNYTNNNTLNFILPSNTSVNFNVTANQSVSYLWTYDGSYVGGNFNNFSYPFTSTGPHYINVSVNNTNGTDYKNWTINVVNEIIDVTLSNVPVNFSSLSPGDLNKSSIQPLNVTIQSTTNVNVNLTLQASDFISGINNLGVGNLTYSNSSNGTTKTVMTNSFPLPPYNNWVNILPFNTSNYSIYLWLSVPVGQTAGSYSSNVTVRVEKYS